MLHLYYKPSCPFCQKVFAFADAKGIEFDLKDITEYEELVDELIEVGGKKQVPFLVDDTKDVSMYESDDIIDYLKTNYANEASAPSKPRVHVSAAACVSCEG